jgi:hypothetical protein
MLGGLRWAFRTDDPFMKAAKQRNEELLGESDRSFNYAEAAEQL